MPTCHTGKAEGPWEAAAADEAVTCDLAMGNLPGCTETFDLESLELLDSTGDFEELFPERRTWVTTMVLGITVESWRLDDVEDEDSRPTTATGMTTMTTPCRCFEECEELAMAVEGMPRR